MPHAFHAVLKLTRLLVGSPLASLMHQISVVGFLVLHMEISFSGCRLFVEDSGFCCVDVLYDIIAWFLTSSLAGRQGGDSAKQLSSSIYQCVFSSCGF
jgi:hypothetical protein